MLKQMFFYFTQPSVQSLLIANATIIYGVVKYDWSFSAVLYIYLFETILIGFYSVLHFWHRIEGTSSSLISFIVGRLAVSLVFSIGFGILILLNFSFLSTVFPLFENDLRELAPGMFLLFISHGVSYLFNYQEYLSLTDEELFIKPFKRAMFPHFIFVLFLFPFSLYWGTGGPVVTFAILRTIAELGSHIWDHQSFWLTKV